MSERDLDLDLDTALATLVSDGFLDSTQVADAVVDQLGALGCVRAGTRIALPVATELLYAEQIIRDLDDHITAGLTDQPLIHI